MIDRCPALKLDHTRDISSQKKAFEKEVLPDDHSNSKILPYRNYFRPHLFLYQSSMIITCLKLARFGASSFGLACGGLSRSHSDEQGLYKPKQCSSIDHPRFIRR